MRDGKETIRPMVGAWYKEPRDHEPFEVVAVDEDSGSVEIQYFGGDLDEIETEDWASLELAEIDPPHDWTAALEPLDEDDEGKTTDEYEPSIHRVFRPGFEDEDGAPHFNPDLALH